MKQNKYPALEGIELLTAQAIAAIEAAKNEESTNCDACEKSAPMTIFNPNPKPPIEIDTDIR